MICSLWCLLCTGAAPDAAAAAAKLSPTPVVSLQHLNEVHAAVLLVGCADGGVRVWRNHTFAGQQRLSTAFQACPAMLFLQVSQLHTSLRSHNHAGLGVAWLECNLLHHKAYHCVFPDNEAQPLKDFFTVFGVSRKSAVESDL